MGKSPVWSLLGRLFYNWEKVWRPGQKHVNFSYAKVSCMSHWKCIESANKHSLTSVLSAFNTNAKTRIVRISHHIDGPSGQLMNRGRIERRPIVMSGRGRAAHRRPPGPFWAGFLSRRCMVPGPKQPQNLLRRNGPLLVIRWGAAVGKVRIRAQVGAWRQLKFELFELRVRS